MEYAVIRTGGKQYRVTPGDVIEVDKLETTKESNFTFDDVLLWVSNGQVKIGTPVVSGIHVTAKVLDQVKGDKIHVYKFKSKVRERRKTGFRASLTRIQIEKIVSGNTGTKESPKTEAKATSSTPRKAKKTV